MPPPIPRRVYAPHERPAAEVEVDGEWLPAEVRMWLQGDDGSWSAQVAYHRALGMTYLDTLPAERVRQA